MRHQSSDFPLTSGKGIDRVYKDAEHERLAAKAREWRSEREATKAPMVETRRQNTPGPQGVHPLAIPLVISAIGAESSVDNLDKATQFLSRNIRLDRKKFDGVSQAWWQSSTGDALNKASDSSRFERKQFDRLSPAQWRSNRAKAAKLVTGLGVLERVRRFRKPSRMLALKANWSLFLNLGRPLLATQQYKHEPNAKVNSLIKADRALGSPQIRADILSEKQLRGLLMASQGYASQRSLRMAPEILQTRPGSDVTVLRRSHRRLTALPEVCMPISSWTFCAPFPPNSYSAEIIPGFLAFMNWSITMEMISFQDAVDTMTVTTDLGGRNLTSSCSNCSLIDRLRALVEGANSTSGGSSTGGGIGALLLSLVNNITVDGAVVLGSESDYSSPLTLAMQGVYRPNGMHEFHVQSTAWTPMKFLPVLALPGISGELLVDNGDFELRVATESFNLTMIPYILHLQDAQATVLIKGEGNSTPSAMELSLFTYAQVGGGDHGFQVSLNGTIDPAVGSARLILTHDGGWSPLPGVLGQHIQTPAFDGAIVYNRDGVYMSLEAAVTFTGPVPLIPGYVTLSNIPGDREDEQELGDRGCTLVNDAVINCCVGIGAGVVRCEDEDAPWIETMGPTIGVSYVSEAEPARPPPPPISGMCSVIDPPGATVRLWPDGCRCDQIPSGLGGRVVCDGHGLPAVPSAGIPEIPLLLSAVVAPCGAAAYIGITASMTLPGTSTPEMGDLINRALVQLESLLNTDGYDLALNFDHTQNELSLTMQVTAGSSMAFPVPIYTDPVLGITLSMKFIVIVTGNVEELGAKIKLDICLKLPLLHDPYCGHHLPTCDPAPTVYDVSDGVTAQEALCIATNSMINFNAALFSPPYMIADVQGLQFNSICNGEQQQNRERRRKLSLDTGRDATINGTVSSLLDVLKLMNTSSIANGTAATNSSLSFGRVPQPVEQEPERKPVRFYEYGTGEHALRKRNLLASNSANGTNGAANSSNGTSGIFLPPGELTVSFEGRVVIGDLLCDLTGNINTARGTGEFTVDHEGGWAPIAALSEYISTPAFTGSMRMNVDGIPLAIDAEVSLLEPVNLVWGQPDIIQIGYIPRNSSLRSGGVQGYGDAEEYTSANTEEEEPKGLILCLKQAAMEKQLVCSYNVLISTFVCISCGPSCVQVLRWVSR